MTTGEEMCHRQQRTNYGIHMWIWLIVWITNSIKILM
jgi:hypothetical protein